jgi:hypothetical protein
MNLWKSIRTKNPLAELPALLRKMGAQAPFFGRQKLVFLSLLLTSRT